MSFVVAVDASKKFMTQGGDDSVVLKNQNGCTTIRYTSDITLSSNIKNKSICIESTHGSLFVRGLEAQKDICIKARGTVVVDGRLLGEIVHIWGKYVEINAPIKARTVHIHADDKVDFADQLVETTNILITAPKFVNGDYIKSVVPFVKS